MEWVNRLLGFFEGAWNWLYDAGRAIIQGFLDGLTSGFQAVEDAFNWLTDRIPDWKGPIGKDERLLYGAGVAVITGFEKGVTDKFRDVENTMTGMTGKVEEAFKKIDAAGAGPSGDNAIRQLRTTNVAAKVQRQLMEEARKAAIKENQLRLKLPLLEGAARKKALEEIHRLEQQQQDAIRRSGGVRAVTDLRKERQAALGKANRAAVQAQELRSKLPGLEGEERKKALEKIRQLDETRAAELKKAKDVQTELIKVFRDLPAGVRRLLNEARRDRDEKIERERQKDREESRAGSGLSGLGKFGKSPVGTSGDPVFTALKSDPDFGKGFTTGPVQFDGGGFDFGGKKGPEPSEGEKKLMNRNTAAVEEMGRRIPPLAKSAANTDAGVKALLKEERDQRQERAAEKFGLDPSVHNLGEQIKRARAQANRDSGKVVGSVNKMGRRIPPLEKSTNDVVNAVKKSHKSLNKTAEGTLEVGKAARKTAKVTEEMGRRIPPLQKSSEKVAETVRTSQKENRVEMRLGLRSNAQNIRAKIAELRSEQREQGSRQRDQDRSLAASSRSRLTEVRRGLEFAGHVDAIAIVDAIQRTRTERPERPNFHGTKGSGRPQGQAGDTGGGGKNVTNNVTVNNPVRERASDSLIRHLRNKDVGMKDG